MLSTAILARDQPLIGRSMTLRIPPAVAPICLVATAVLAAGVLAYGTRPSLGRFDFGIDLIILVRRIQWPVVGLSLLACLGLLTMVISGKVPAAWLVGLAPVLGLFIVRFAPRYAQPMGVLDAPVFVEPTHAGAPQSGDWVVGVTFEGQAYALPFRALYATPIVTVTDYNKRLLLMWSSGANRATAVQITRDLRPRALEIVSTPGDGLLIFDHRYGQFISAITARTTQGGDPIGFADAVPVIKTTWAVWRAMQPDTRVMLPSDTGPAVSARPLGPRVALPKRAARDAPAQTMVAVLDCRPPVAVRSDLPLKAPINAIAGQTRLLIVRDPRTGSVRAFERRVADDLFPTFALHSDPRRAGPSTLVDSDTASVWALDGRAISGPLKGERLREIPTEDLLWWGVMKFWYPDLQLLG